MDQEPDGAMSRLTNDERVPIMKQEIEEVWFRGCHSDIGCGQIALRWILAEAAHARIRLSDEGGRLLPSQQLKSAEIHESHTLFWRLVERIPRNEIDNSGEWPRTIPARTPNAPRHPGKLLRRKMASMHESVGAQRAGVRVVRTKAFQDQKT
jgi:hypothetical protein